MTKTFWHPAPEKGMQVFHPASDFQPLTSDYSRLLILPNALLIRSSAATAVFLVKSQPVRTAL
jgi:hypothetical protein